MVLQENSVLIRLTIQDKKQTISFLVNEKTLLRLVAGCSINPADLGELLIASDIYQRGLAVELMAGLMDFDKAIHRQGPAFIHHAIRKAEESGQDVGIAFEVIDEITRTEALHSSSYPLVVINLSDHTIRSSREIQIFPDGDVGIQIGDVESDRRVRYILPQEWTIGHL